MKYAIYDKAADGYLTKFEVEHDVPDQVLGLSCGYNEYIKEAKLLDTKEEAVAVVTRIESNKFMEKGRFVIHSFDDTLKDQYIISEAGNPTKVVDNITVDLEGTINVKYGTMALHWSTASLEYAITRMNALQKAKSPKYTAWCNTFDIYKVLTVMDENEHTHYQFINVTENGVVCAKEEENALTKRIEELEKANYDLGEQVYARGAVANRLQEENDNLKNKVAAIKKEARDWKKLYNKADKDREVLTNVIDNIYDDLGSTDICKNLKETYDYVKTLSELNYIKIHNDDTDDGKSIYITAAAEFKYIIDRMITIMESLKLNQSVAFAAADDVHELRVARDCSAEIIRAIRNAICDNNSGAFDCIESRMIHDSDFNSSPFMAGVRENVKDICTAEKRNLVNHELKNGEIAKAADALNEVNDKNEGLMNMLKEVTGYIVDIMLATRTVDHDTMISELVGISNKIGCKTSDDGPMFGVRAILNALINIAKEETDWKHRAEETKNVVTVITKERDKALERAEFYKRQANSVYGMSIPGRCCGKQVFADVTTGKKILINKKKYDDLVEYVAAINSTYDTIFHMMDRPVYLSTITDSLNNLTK